MKSMRVKRVSGFLVLVFLCLVGFSIAKPSSQQNSQLSGQLCPKKIAAICTAYQPRWHADVIITKFLAGFPTDEGIIPPRVKIVSMYIDQGNASDLGHKIAAHYKIPLYTSITDALTLGGDKLAVDGILLIAEHGSYPVDRFGMTMYPRMRMEEEVFRVFEQSRCVVPIFHDKHLSYNWLDSKWIYDRAKDLDVPFMAGSCLPLVWRNPPLEHPVGCNISEAVVLAYHTLNSYGIHGLEILQSMLERRKGGETGVASVQCVRGRAFYKAAEEGKFSLELVREVLGRCSGIDIEKKGPFDKYEKHPIAIIVSYNDGTKGTVVMMDKYYGQRWFYGAKVDGNICATEIVYKLPPNYKDLPPAVPAFSYLCLNIEQMFVSGRPQYPIERTLLTSGIIAAAGRSVADGGRIIDTPFLDIKYKPYAIELIRPKTSFPRGASLGPWPPKSLKPFYQD